VYTRASLTDILARKSARVGQVGGQIGEYRRAYPARAEVGEDVRIGVGVVVGPMEFQLYGRTTFARTCSDTLRESNTAGKNILATC